MKKIMIFCLMLAIAMVPLFASDTSGGVDGKTSTIGGIDLAPVARVLTLIVGVFGGIYVLIKTAIDLVHAVTNQEQDPQAVRKCVIRFLVAVVIIGAFFGLRAFLIGTSNQETGDKKANSVFYEVLSIEGSEVTNPAIARDFSEIVL